MRGSRVRVPFSASNLIPRNLRGSKGFGGLLLPQKVLEADHEISQVTAFLGVGKKGKMKYNKNRTILGKKRR